MWGIQHIAPILKRERGEASFCAIDFGTLPHICLFIYYTFAINLHTHEGNIPKLTSANPILTPIDIWYSRITILRCASANMKAEKAIDLAYVAY